MAAAPAMALGWVLLCLLVAGQLATAARQPQDSSITLDKRHKHKHPYSAPAGWFIQERASKMLPGAGQHFNFGALKPWEDILQYVDEKENSKLLLIVRHGQAVSNYLGELLGPDEWFKVEGTCQYDDKQGTIYNVFDADLTGTGHDQAVSLNSILNGGGWYSKMTGGMPVRAIISPLTRCLHTATEVLRDIKVNATNVEEFVRETLGEDTCDARRSVSDPGTPRAEEDINRRPPRPGPAGPCSFDKGIASLYPQYKYRVYDPEVDEDRKFGLLGDSDHLWTTDQREQQKAQVKRATKFLNILFKHAPEPVVVVVTHSGFARSILLAAQREPYRPQNAELIPAVIEQRKKKGVSSTAEQQEQEEEDDSWIDDVLERHAEVLRQQEEEDNQLRGRKKGQQEGVQKQSPCLIRRFFAWAMQKIHEARQ